MRPGTRKNLNSCQTLFVQFCIVYGIPVEAPTIDDVEAFTELLVEAGLSVAPIKNYSVATKTLYAEWGLVRILKRFDVPAWKFMLKGLAYSADTRQDTRTAMTMEDLMTMVNICDKDKALWPLQVALTFGYFGYLRVSNLAPETVTSFDPTRHTTWADVRPEKEGIILGMKWTKTLQARRGATPIPLPEMGNTTVCPVYAYLKASCHPLKVLFDNA